MALHYANLNSISTVINCDSDPLHYPNQVGVLGFVDKEVIAQIKHPTSEIVVSPTFAAIKKDYESMPDNHLIGNEIRLPKPYHLLTANFPIFSIKGGKRLFPLNTDTGSFQRKLCR